MVPVSLKAQSTDRCVFNIRSFNVAMGNKGHHSLWHSPKKIDHAPRPSDTFRVCTFVLLGLWFSFSDSSIAIVYRLAWLAMPKSQAYYKPIVEEESQQIILIKLRRHNGTQ